MPAPPERVRRHCQLERNPTRKRLDAVRPRGQALSWFEWRECHEWKSTANPNPQEASSEGKAAEASSEVGERASARAFRAGSEAAEDGWLAEEVAPFSACDIAPDGIVKLTKAQLITPRDIEVEPIVSATCCAAVWEPVRNFVCGA